MKILYFTLGIKSMITGGRKKKQDMKNRRGKMYHTIKMEVPTKYSTTNIRWQWSVASKGPGDLCLWGAINIAAHG